MALRSFTELLRIGFHTVAAEVGAQAGTGVVGHDTIDDLDFVVEADKDCRIEAIDLTYPVGSTVSAYLSGGMDILDVPFPAGAAIELVDNATATLVSEASVGSQRVLKKQGAGALVISITGGLAGLKRAVVRATPLGGR